MSSESRKQPVPDVLPPLSQTHLTTILNASHDVFFILDSDSNTILHVNETVERVLGYTPKELSGTPFPSLVAEEGPDHLAHCKFFDGVFGPVAFRRKDGGLCQGDVTAAVIPWEATSALLYTMRDATQRTALEEEKAALIHDLQRAMATVQRLSGLIPICANCKRIRDDEGYWETVEEYISAHSSAHFSHSICPPCREILYPGLPHTQLLETSPLDSDCLRRFQIAESTIERYQKVLDRVTGLRLYGLRQQAMLGDCSVEQFDFTDGFFRARVDSWKVLRGTTKERARAMFVDLVAEVVNRSR